MAPVQGDVSSSQNCSCTSCFYKSESDHPSIRKMMAQGSRIDRLYIGKYIPLREWKLLDKLVRTRAVYDDVRNQLISGSSIIINKKADLNPKNKLAPTDKELDDIEKSGDISELVELVDKGAVLGPKTVSECCSCCFCSSNALLAEHASKGRRHRHDRRHRHEHVHGHRHEHGHRHGDARESSNASDVSGHGIGMESRRIKNLKIVAKQIQSDPCTCSTKLSGMIKRRSKAMLKKLRAERPDPMFDESYDSEWADTRQRRWQERGAKIKKSLREIKQTHEIENEISKFRLVESLTKVNRSKTKLRNNLETATKKSLEKMNNAKIKIKDNMKTHIKESFQKIRPNSDQNKSSIEENMFKVKKDSITKFRENIDRKRQLKKNKVQTTRRHKHEKSSGDMSNVSDISMQARKNVVTAKTGTKQKRSRKTGSSEQRVSIDFTVKKGDVKQVTTSQIQGKVTKPKEVGNEEITTKDREEETKPKGGKQGSARKKHLKGKVFSTQKSKQEIATRIQDKRIKSKEVNKKDKIIPINEKFNITKSVKSMLSVDSKGSKHSMSSPFENRTKELKKPEGLVEKISSKYEFPHQAVKIGSSISFSIEFSKDKPSSKTNIEANNISSIKHKVKTRDRGQGQMRSTNHHNKYADARHKQLPKDTQASLALKRCFCTLKLKGKKTKLKATKSKLIAANLGSESVSDAVQTKKQPASVIKEHPPQLTYKLLPYECEPFVCIPGECNPIECEKIIKQRNRKHHTARTNTNYNMKSTPSFTSRSISSASSRRIQVSSPNKPKKNVSSTSNSTLEPDDSLKPHKQVVRISSSFSFNIEFHKDDQSNALDENNDLQYKSKEKKIPIKRKKNKTVNNAKEHIKHKRSQMSSSTGKSKYTITKHSLRKCFCTLKLAKTDKNRMRGKQLSKSTITSGQKIRHIRSVQPEVMSRSIATNKAMSRNIPRCKLLPYECEPGICEPGYCNPYDCLEVIKRRDCCLRRRNIQSNTDNRKIRSTSSLTTRSVSHSKAKKIQSTLAAYKREVPVHYMKKNTTAPREVKTLPSSRNKQAVRIGSSFSFDIELFKEKSLPMANAPVENIQKQKIKKNERGFQRHIKKHSKSTLMEKKERSVLIGPAMKRCFCTLKLHKTGKLKKNINDFGTETPKFKNKVYPKVENVSKGTKTNHKYKHTQRLDPYECEPNFCVPGECDPYECLERIKRRDVESREFGITTNRSKMKTTSSFTKKLSSRSKKIYVQTNGKKIKSVKKQNLQKGITPSEQSRKSLNIFPGKLSRQAVKISSTFSFDIQLKKYFSGIMNGDKIMSIDRNIKKLKNRGEQPLKLPVIQRESQGDIPRKQNRATGVGRILKRCFCTLQLQNDQQKQHRHNQTFTHLKSPKIYAISRIAVADNKLMRSNNWDEFNPSVITEPNSVFKFNDSIQSYFLKSMESTLMDQSFSQTIMKETLEVQSNITSKVTFLKEINDIDVFNKTVKTKTEFQLPTEKYLKTAFNSFNSTKYQNSQIIAANSSTSNINGFSQFLKRRFCTMNIQVPGRDKSYKWKSSTASTDSRPQVNVKNKRPKLEPYECEPGVCIPYECDPIVCQKRIMNRLMKRTSKMSGTNIRSKSSSSSASLSKPNLKGKKIQSNRSRPSKDSRETRQGIAYETVPATRKQAVRVGSKFSFDIEFSKNRSQSSIKKINKPEHSNKRLKAMDPKLKTKGTKSSSGSRHHRESQSRLLKLQDRASNISPLLKRCFCTLKLQKKGKLQKERALKVNQGTVTPPNTRQDVVKTRYINAEQNTSSQKAHKLLPYECEPNVCVPGECDPYECLELIKKRKRKTKHSGTDSGRSISTSSSTIKEKKKNKGKYIQSNIKHKPKIKNLKKDLKSIVSYATKPPRQSKQAVRIGSCFSFDVEFYKDRKYHGDQVPNKQLKYVTSSRKSKLHEHRSKQVGREKKLKNRSLQDSKVYTNKNSQMEGLAKQSKSSMTNAIIKRCFCTLKAFRNTQKPVKKQVAASSTETVALIQQNKFERDKAVQHGRKYRPPTQLDPYECEPGICIPDACDPYVCEQIIKKRNARYDSKTTGTERVITKSVSSASRSKPPKLKEAQSSASRSKPPKVKQAQSQPERVPRKVKPRSSQEFSTSEKYHLPMSTNKQAVRIGSTFSFDIEFYKEKSPHYRQVQAAAKAIKEKPPRKQFKSREVKIKPKTNNKGVTNKEISLHSRQSQAQTLKHHSQGSGVGPLLKRCFCTLKLAKQRKLENIKVLPEKIIPDVQTKSVMTVTKQRPIKYSLKPYECEPGVCIPGECDPYECDKLIQKRNRRDSSTTMGHQARKSSWAKSSGKNRNKNIQHASKHKKRLKYNNTSSKIRQPKKFKDISNNKRSKQAVKIGSNFSFNVEFFKAKSYGSGDIQRQLPKQRHDTKESTNNTSIKQRNQKSQRAKGVRHMDSQVFAKKMRSTMTGVSPFLKRCFCTLKLQKEYGKKQVYTKTASTDRQKKMKLEATPPIGSTNKGTYTDKTRTKHSPKNLEPYECEPGVCVPYECDPYECEKRIKKRLMRSQYSSTDRPKSHSVSIVSSDSVSSSPKKSQATYHSRERKYQKTGKENKTYQRNEVRRSSASCNRQAVKIGSNFSFNVEFFKDRSQGNVETFKDSSPGNVEFFKDIIMSQDHNVVRAHDTRNYPLTNLEKLYKMKEVATKLKTRDFAGLKEDINALRNRHSQSEEAKTESKSSGMGPLLKRCFCTLKLQNGRSNQKQPHRKDIRETITKYSPVIEARNVNVSTAIGRRIRSLEPYECEPNVCVPGKCDPFECEKRIKLRMKEQGIRTDSSDMRSTSSSTSQRPRMKSKVTRAEIAKEAKVCRKVFKDTKPKQNSFDPSDYGRQSVGFDSNLSFSFEFFKDRTLYHQNNINKRQLSKQILSPNRKPTKEIKIIKKQTKTKHQSSICKSGNLHNQNMQSETIKTETKGSGMGSVLKRCFCTLTLQKKTGLPNKESKPPKVSTQSKSTSTKQKKIPYILESYECEPLSCIPGKCDPYECLKRIQKRGIRRRSRSTAIHTKRSSQKSMSNMTSQLQPQSKSKRKQTNIIRKNDGISMVVEQPRFAINRPAVKIGSNISFNIEFYKETLPFNNSSDVKHTKRVPKERNSNLSSLKNKCIPSKSGKSHNTETQVEGVKTENKSSAISNALKRCFCTAKLHKPITPQTKRASWQKNMNVYSVNPSMAQNSPFFKPVQCYFQYQHPNKNDLIQKCIEICAVRNNKSKDTKSFEKEAINRKVPFNVNQLDKDSNKRQLSNFKENVESRKMETIFPYTPSKFKKSVSKSVLPLKKDENTKMVVADTKQYNNSTASKISKNRRLTAKQGKKSIKSKPIDKLTLKSNPLHEAMCLCKQIFTKQNKAKPSGINISISNKKKHKCDVGPQTKTCTCSKRLQADVLKISKSERSAKNLKTNSEPKKSKSLKGAIVSKQRKCSDKCPFTVQEKRKFSIFQGGDAKQTHMHTSKNIDKEHKRDSKKKIVQFSNISLTESKKQIQNKIPQGKISKRSYKNINNIDNIKIKSSKLTSFVSRCICKLSNITKGNSKQIEVHNQTESVKKLQKIQSQGFVSKFKMVPCAKLGVKPKKKINKGTCSNLTCAELCMKRQLGDQGEERKAKPNTKPCICGNSLCAKEQKRLLKLRKEKNEIKNKNSYHCRFLPSAKETQRLKELPNDEKFKKSAVPGISASIVFVNESKKMLDSESKSKAKKKKSSKTFESFTEYENKGYKQKYHHYNEKKTYNNNDENIKQKPSRLSNFVSRCLCKLSNIKPMEVEIQKEPVQEIHFQGKRSQTAQNCKKNNNKNNANKIPLSSGDGLTMSVLPSFTRLNMKKCFCGKDPKKSLPEINISGSKIILPNNIVPKYRNNKSPVLIKSIQYTNIQKTQGKHLPVIKISNDIITYPESLLLPKEPPTNSVPKRSTSKHKMLPCAKIIVKAKKKMKKCICSNLTCAELSMKHQLEEQEEERKAMLNTKPCICGNSTCAKETKKRLLDAVKKAKKIKVPNCICKSPVCVDESMKLLSEKQKLATERIPKPPCICGSSLCANEQKRLLKLQKEENKVKKKVTCTCTFLPCTEERKRLIEIQNDEKLRKSAVPCVCGSKVCDKESKKMLESKLKSKEMKKKAMNKKKTVKKKKNKCKTFEGLTDQEIAEYKPRLKKYLKEDAIIRKKRLKQQKYLDKQVNRFKKSDDCQLLAESALDVGKFTCNVASDILRCTYRSITDLPHAKTTVKTAVKHPKQAGDNLKKAMIDAGALSTSKRLGRRCASMKRVKLFKKKLEENALTNYLLHIADEDPKKRLNKKKKPPKKNQREPLDFGCSLYMASLRRRPYLAVYYICPWFYPHFISLLTLLKQFFDLSLFLLAVCVWSPCIVGMEMCRGLMCCFFCTG